MNINATIAAAFIAHRAAGKTVAEAFDAVFGAGAHAELVSDLYDAFNASTTEA